MVYFRINCSTKGDRHRIISISQALVSQSGGWITDFKMYSNISINLNIAIPINKIQVLFENIKGNEELELMRGSEESLVELIGKISASDEYDLDEDATGTFQITFIHNEKDLRIPLPQVPG